MGLLALGFISGTFFGIFVIALAQAAGRDARAPTPLPKVRHIAAADVDHSSFAMDADPYATAVTGSFRQQTG